MGRVLLSVVSLLLAVSVLLTGCTKTEKADEPKKSESVDQSNGTPVREGLRKPPMAPEPGSAISDPGETVSAVVFKNSEGEILCPVMEIVIESPEAAEGSKTVDGVTYYFSSKDAQEFFEEDPSEYIE